MLEVGRFKVVKVEDNVEMSRVPKVEKFKGDNTQNFAVWIKQFEAHCTAITVADARKLDAFQCCVEGTAFTYVCDLREDEENPATYATVKAALQEKFCGEEFKRNLEIKLQNLRFKKDTCISPFIDELYTTIKQLYNIKDAKIVSSIATSHVINNLDPSLREEAKIFQLSGNNKLENLLEVISVKLKSNTFGDTEVVGTAAMSLSERSRLERLENMMEKVLTKLGEGDSSRGSRNSLCEECQKPGHSRQNCFKLKTCYRCQEVGHIGRHCKKKMEASALKLNGKGQHSDTSAPEQRTMVQVGAGGKTINCLYDTGSQYSIFTRETYNTLKVKPPLSDVTRLGSGIDGHQFKFDGIIYINLTFKTESGLPFTLDYEPVLISSVIKCNIFGAKTENRFKSCSRDISKGTITYRAETCEEPITINCFKEKLSTSNAFIEVLSVATIPKDESQVIKCRVSNLRDIHEQKSDTDLFNLIECPDNVERFKFSEYVTSQLHKRLDITVENTSQDDLRLKRGDVIGEIELIEPFRDEGIQVYAQEDNKPALNKNDFEYLSETEFKRMKEILDGYYEKIKNKNVTNSEIGYEHGIVLRDDEPVINKPRRLPRAYEKEINEQIAQLLEDGVIRTSDSPYASPVVPVVKRDGSIRLCCDFRRLNAKTIPNVYPIPRTENIFEKFKGAEVFTVLDLKSAYWHIPIKEEDKYKTAFVSSQGKYEWNVLPFGITDAAFALSRVMHGLLMEYDFTESFYDDCALFSIRIKHLDQLEMVLDKFASHGMIINFKKCQFMKSSVIFLGHIVSVHGVKPNDEKTLEIVKFDVPKDVRTLKTFLGMAAFYRKFLPDFAEKAATLYSLLKKDAVFQWNEEQQKSFDALKKDLQSSELLIYPDFEKPFVIRTDASKKALGFALLQETDGVLRPVLFGGRSLSAAESRYATTDLELLGVYFAVKKCEYYLVGNNFVVYTDHKPLIHLKAFKDVVNKRYRWIQYLESLNVVIRYIEGKDNIESDYISRNIKVDEKWAVLANCMDIGKLTAFAEEDLGVKQRNDVELKEVMNNIMQSSKLPKKFNKYTNRLFIKRDTLLYRHHGKEIYVAPREIRNEILTLGHSQALSGHHGIFKTHRRILETCWWPELYQDIKKYIKSCETCVRANTEGRKKSKLGKRPFPQVPLEWVSIDFIVDLPRTEKGHIHIFTIVDNFTKFIKVYAIKDRTAATAARCMYDYCMQFGVPKIIYSDKDPAFQSMFFGCLLNLLGISKKSTTGYNPRANGQCEKSNGIIKLMLTKYVNVFGGEWDEWLRELQYAYNSSVHTSTGFSPAELLYGRKLRIPLDIVYAYKNADDEPFRDIGELRANLSEIYELVRKNMNVRQDTAAAYYDKKIVDDILEADSLVYVHNPRRKKLEFRWSGPYKVREVKHPSYLVVVEERGQLVEKWFTRDKLRRKENELKLRSENVEERYDTAQDCSSSSSDDEIPENDLSRSTVYNLRRNVRMPERYGSYVTHFVEVCGHTFE